MDHETPVQKQNSDRTAEVLEKGIKVSLARTPSTPSKDQSLWAAIRNRSQAVAFKQYCAFINDVFCQNSEKIDSGQTQFTEGVINVISKNIDATRHPPPVDTGEILNELWDARLSVHAADAYGVLRLATEVFLLLECGVVIDTKGIDGKPIFDTEKESDQTGTAILFEDVATQLCNYLDSKGRLPYLHRILTTLLGEDETKWVEKLPYCEGVLRYRTTRPSMLELIWSYWHEEAMQVQSMNAISLRFQNRRGSAENDPLANLEIDSLRPLNNLLWGYIQNEQNRLTVPRRAYEYDHHYGLTLYGKAVPQLRSADSRSKFLEGFHSLLHQTVKFYQQDANTTVVADGFPLLNALKEVHILLSEGAHNQFGDLPWTARVEMLIEQWLLARPEMREFLHGRTMVPYHEAWMGTVDTMKKLQGWSDVSVTHFNDLAAFGEQVLLSVRYGDWGEVNEENHAKNWARYWKPEIQSYIHSYRAATGVDLTTEPVDSTPPWVHLKRQEDARRRAGRG